jgi:hypothetical protein
MMTLAVTQPLLHQLHSPVWRSESLGPQCASNELPLMKGRGRWMPLLCCLRSGIILGYCAGGVPLPEEPAVFLCSKRQRDIKMVPTLLHGHTTHCLPLRHVFLLCVHCSKSS